MLTQLRQTLQRLEKPAGLVGCPAILPLGVSFIDAALGGGLTFGALHEIAATGEAHVGVAAGFVATIACLSGPNSSRASPTSVCSNQSRNGREESAHDTRGSTIVWIAEDLALAESGTVYGPGLATFGLRPERLLTVAAACRRDLLWAMEEALRCRAICAVIGELRHDAIDMVAMRRLSLAAAESGTLGLLLRASPPNDASTAATRWIVSAAPSSFADGSQIPLISVPTGIQNSSRRHSGTGPPFSQGRAEDAFTTFAVQLTRNRRGPLGSWIVQWSDDDERFVFATPAQPMAAPTADRPRRAVA